MSSRHPRPQGLTTRKELDKKERKKEEKKRRRKRARTHLGDRGDIYLIDLLFRGDPRMPTFCIGEKGEREGKEVGEGTESDRGISFSTHA